MLESSAVSKTRSSGTDHSSTGDTTAIIVRIVVTPIYRNGLSKRFLVLGISNKKLGKVRFNPLLVIKMFVLLISSVASVPFKGASSLITSLLVRYSCVGNVCFNSRI